MKTLVFLLEEPSAMAMLEGVLPKVLPPDITARYIVFAGKQDLEKQLPGKLRGWRLPDSTFVVMRDQDSGDCMVIKKNLQNICWQAGHPETLIRIACRELESFYLGDLNAVEKGLGVRGLAKKQDGKNFRRPDSLPNASQELKRITGQKYQKLSGSRAIGPHMSITTNRSTSFNALINGILRIVAGS